MATEEKSGSDRISDAVRDVTDVARDYSPRLFRSGILAAVESVRLAADAFGTFTQKILDTERLNEPEGWAGLAQQLPGDVAEGVADAARSLAEIPAKAADKFAETYPKPEDKQ